MAIPRKLIFNNIQIKYGPISGVFLIAFALRLFRLGYHDFWYDEIGSVGYALCPWNHWNAPLYGIVLHFWVKIFGVSEFSLRMPSLIFSFLSVVLIFFFGKELFNKKTGLIAASLMALSPFHLWYAQEARDYSMLLFFGLLSSCFLFKALKNPDGKNWIFFLLASLAGLYANYFFIFLFIAQGRYVGMFKKAAFSLKTVICFLLVILWFTLYLPRFLEKFYFVWAGFWLPKPEW
ncbi:MAG: glycosyltransferase family 39 protein, partial [Candidatus Omnitrophica bacterium]|nr:glycosyltransferase family 39 protein [Candidatus Omnitrophota bacterium]